MYTKKKIKKKLLDKKKKEDEHTKEREEKWMRSNRERQKMKEEIDKRGKKKVLLVEISIQNTWDFSFSLFSLIFSLIWGDCILWARGENTCAPLVFPNIFSFK